MEADRAPAGVGHFGLVPEARKFRCHAQDVGQTLCHREKNYKLGVYYY